MTDPYDRDAELAALNRKLEASQRMHLNGGGYQGRITMIQARIAELEADAATDEG